ncbi:MAG: hypothetical protein O8C61_12565 [Candidatus Methanoperedens sp.]|nr:hypothetical protein [Candidatus Methanoperedens sp.]
MVEETWLGQLRELFEAVVKIDIRNIKFSLINIQVNSNNSSKQFGYDEDGRVDSINLKKFSPTEKRKIGELLREAQNEGTTLLLKESQELIKDIKLKEESSDVKPLLEFFKTKIPPNDYNALRAAIYIDKRFKEGGKFGEIYRLKGDVARKYDGRGLKICNIYASGYFETMIKPLYEEFSQQGFDRTDFINKYNIIVNEEAFALFVRTDMDGAEVKTAIKIKMSRNLKYGRRDVTIHGIGRSNAEKIRKAISDIEDEKEFPNFDKHIEETGNIILAKLSF